jgi:hypothetical protein
MDAIAFLSKPRFNLGKHRTLCSASGINLQATLKAYRIRLVAPAVAVIASVIAVAIARITWLIAYFGMDQFELLLIESFAVDQRLKPEQSLLWYCTQFLLQHCISPWDYLGPVLRGLTRTPHCLRHSQECLS